MENNQDRSSDFEGLELPLEMTEEEREIAKMIMDKSVPIENYYNDKKSKFSWFQRVKD